MMPSEIYPLAKRLWELCENVPDAPSIHSYSWYRDVRQTIDEIKKVAES
jgi:hypothetical protein